MSSSGEGTGWTVFVLPSSHNDIGWAGTPTEIAEHRATAIIDSVLSLMEKDPEFAFTIEAALYLQEYVDRRPERVPLLRQFMEEGRLECGGSYIQPYEGLLSGESLIRQMRWGRGWIEQEFGFRVEGYWNIDVAGRTRQIPNILAKSGIRYMVLSRNQPGLYWWEAPDGSRVLVLSFMEGAYGHAPVLRPLSSHLSPLETRGSARHNPAASPDAIARTLMPMLEEWEPFYQRHGLPRHFLIIATADYSVPDERLREFIDDWNQRAELGELGLHQPVRMRFGSAAQYITSLLEHNDLSSLDVVSGELPNPWIYIHGPCHHKTVQAMRESSQWLSVTESFGTAQEFGLSVKPFASYERDVDQAWLDHLYPDHGYGGLHGEGTDEIFRAKEESALFRAQAVGRKVTADIANLVRHRDGAIRQLTVFNSLSWARSGWAETEIIFSPEDEYEGFTIEDGEGQSIDFHVLDCSRTSTGSLRRAKVGFLARDVPSLGYKAYWLVPGERLLESKPGRPESLVGDEFVWNSAFARIRISRGGMVEYFDRNQRRNMISPDYYLGFEVIELGSPGHDVGIGERDIAVYDWTANRPFQPNTVAMERTLAAGSPVEILEDGPIRTVVSTMSQFSHCQVTQRFALYHELDLVDVSIDVDRWDGTHGRELRLMVPFGQPEAEISYDVPFGHVVVDQDEAHNWGDVRPREVQNWIHARGPNLRTTMSSSVVAHDWLDPAGLTDRVVLQAILLATKRSCHPRGPWYTQEGDHAFHVRLSGGPESLVDRTRFGFEAQNPFVVISTDPESARSAASGPVEYGLLSMEPENVAVSALKPGGAQGELIVRLWELEGTATRATIHTAAHVREVWQCNLLEREERLIWSEFSGSTTMPVDVPASGVVTLKLKLEPQQESGR